MAQNLNGVTLTSPSTAQTVEVNNSFTMTIAGSYNGGGSVNAHDFTFEWDQGTGTWVAIPTTSLGTGLYTNGNSSITSKTTTTAESITVFGDATGTFNIRAHGTGLGEYYDPETGRAITVEAASVSLTADSVTSGTPSLGSPTITENIVHTLSANSVETGNPVPGNSTITQNHELTAGTIETGNPILSTSTITQNHELTANIVETGNPVLGTPTYSFTVQTFNLTADSLESQAPVIGSSSISQVHILTSNNLTTGTPILGSSTISQYHFLEATSLTGSSPILGAPVYQLDVQTYDLTGSAIDAGNPVLGTPFIFQSHSLSIGALVTDAPTLESPLMLVHYNLVASSLLGEPYVLGSPVYSLVEKGLILQSEGDNVMKITEDSLSILKITYGS